MVWKVAKTSPLSSFQDIKALEKYKIIAND